MAKYTFEQAKQRADQYASGAIPLSNPEPQHQHSKSSKGFCDYCNQKRPMIMPTGEFWVCWRDICMLKTNYGEKWEIKIRSTLQRNRQIRIQKLAQKKAP